MKRLLPLIFLPIFLIGCTNQPFTSELFSMNTYITQQIYGEKANAVAASVSSFINEVEEKLSLFIVGSDVDKINKNAGVSPVKVDDITFELLKVAKEYSAESGGIFDITIAPLTKLWGITSDNPAVPSPSKIEQSLPLVDYNKLVLNESNKSAMLVNEGMAIDLGGIAKGYICNEINRIYEQGDITGALTSIGGNILVYGAKPNGESFTLGIRDPSGTPNEIAASITVNDCVVATSGGYERFFEDDGKRYHHILDTTTGYPSKSDLLSVTVVCKDGGFADFLSTTLFLAGSNHIKDYLTNEKFDVVVITNDNNVYVSPRLLPNFKLINDKYKLK